MRLAEPGFLTPANSHQDRPSSVRDRGPGVPREGPTPHRPRAARLCLQGERGPEARNGNLTRKREELRSLTRRITGAGTPMSKPQSPLQGATRGCVCTRVRTRDRGPRPGDATAERSLARRGVREPARAVRDEPLSELFADETERALEPGTGLRMAEGPWPNANAPLPLPLLQTSTGNRRRHRGQEPHFGTSYQQPPRLFW